MKEDFQIMYDNLSKMDSLLFDSSGQSYDSKLMNGLENWICFVAYRGLDYIDSWPQSFIPGANVEKHPTAVGRGSDLVSDIIFRRQTKRMELINEELRRIHGNREIIHKSIQNLQASTSKGLSTALRWFRKTPREGSNLVGSGKHLLTMGDRPKPSIEYQTSSGIDGAAQISCQNLRQITRSIEFVNDQLKKIHDGGDVLQKSTQCLQSTTSTGQDFTLLNRLRRIITNKMGKLVGLEEDMLVMLSRLDGYPPKLQVFAVTGMGGIGKTTFTKSLYDDPRIKHHFDIRAWFTISQYYQLREVLIGLLHCITDSNTEIYEWSDEELKDKLYKSLKGMRYLIVLDDVWDKKVWDDLKIIFPDDRSGSRIILTSRLIDVATHASPSNLHRLRCLDEGESWELLYSKISMKELCPELLSIGKEISRKCQGLPLAIIVVGGLLSKMTPTLEVWKDFAQSVSSIMMKKSKYCESVLALSYNHLPDHLKSCFLYMGIFPEDYKISTTKLIWLWIGEGFIRPRELKSYEEVADNYLEDLISRNLIQVDERRSNGRIKTCYIHDMLRDFCLRESHKQNLFHVYDSNGKLMKQIQARVFLRKCRCYCFNYSIPESTDISSLSNARTFLWFKTITSSKLKSYSFINFKLLKVLDINDSHLEELPTGILALGHLRYLALSFQKSIDRSIFSSTFHNIQILTIEGEWNGQLPKEFWAMSNLRRLCLKKSFLSYWQKEARPNIIQLVSASEFPQAFICEVQCAEHSLKVLQSLRSLATIRPIRCTEAVFLSMPNLNELGVYEDEEDYRFRGWFKYIVHLRELQTLKYVFRDPFVCGFMKPDRLPSLEFFLQKLMNLTLSGTSFLGKICSS